MVVGVTGATVAPATIRTTFFAEALRCTAGVVTADLIGLTADSIAVDGLTLTLAGNAVFVCVALTAETRTTVVAALLSGATGHAYATAFNALPVGVFSADTALGLGLVDASGYRLA